MSTPATTQTRAVGLLAILAMLVYPFLVADYPRALLAEIYIFAIFAMSLDLLLGFTGLMSLGHAAFFGLGAYAVAILGTLFGVNAWLALAAGVAVAAAGAAVIGFFCVRTTGIPFLMLTLAFSQLVFSVALKWRDVTGGSDGMAIAEKPALFGFELSDSLAMYFVALVFFLLSYWGLRRLLNAPLGHVFVGIRENEPRMLAIGYPTRAYKLLSFTIAGAFAGLAGGLYAIFNSFISPDAIYWTSSGDILIMTMLGGAGTLIGPAIGAGVFLLMKNVVSSYSEHWLAIIGIIFICCVMFFPGGIWGTLRQIRLAEAQAMSVLRTDHLCRSFGSLVVTNDVNLTVEAGERHVIIGPNGAGKTSLINQIGGQLEPSSGRILVKDTDITGWSPSRISRLGVARTFQRNNLFQNLSVIENLRLAVQARRGGPLNFFTPVGAPPRHDRARRAADAARASRRRRRAARPQPLLRRAAPARDRDRARRRARPAAAGRADLGHVAGRDRPHDRPDREPAAHVLDPDDRARHEGGVLGRRPHHRALLRRGARHRHAGRHPGQRARARGLSRGGALMLDLENVNAYYGDSHILHGVSLAVKEGEVVCLLGRNGAGKTTTILTIMGYLKPRPGRILYRGRDIAALPPYAVARLGFGFVPQERGIFPSLTVRENLTVFARGTAGGRWTLERILELFPSLRARERNLGFQLSGGEQQMLSIARALMLNPSLLLLDEPSEGLAPMIVQDIVEVLRNLKREGLAILLVEQNLRTALAVADRHHVMNKGEICFTGSSGELEGNEFVLRNYLSV